MRAIVVRLGRSPTSFFFLALATGALLLGSTGCEEDCRRRAICVTPDSGGAGPGGGSGSGGGATTSSGGSGGAGGSLGPTTPELVALGWAHSCAYWSNDLLTCWGSNVDGQLGIGAQVSALVPTPVVGVDDPVGLAAGQRHTCAVEASGVIYCWGANDSGQLGDGTTEPRNIPTLVSNIVNASSVALGGSHSCAVTSDGLLWCWGKNNFGQLGDATEVDRTLPTKVAGLSNIKGVSCGLEHTCAWNAAGTFWCWGRNNAAFAEQGGQLGTGDGFPSSTPIQNTIVSDVERVTCGDYFTCAQSTGFKAYCWGHNKLGQVGIGDNVVSYPSPMLVASLPVVQNVSAGSQHSCALLDNGTVSCWGTNMNGQLGDGTTEPSNTPKLLSTVIDATNVYAGSIHNCVIGSDGSLSCWGNNATGQLGNGSTDIALTPIPVTAPR